MHLFWLTKTSKIALIAQLEPIKAVCLDESTKILTGRTVTELSFCVSCSMAIFIDHSKWMYGDPFLNDLNVYGSLIFYDFIIS